MKLSKTLQIGDHVFHIESSGKNKMQIVNPRDMTASSHHWMTPTESMLARKVIELMEELEKKE